MKQTRKYWLAFCLTLCLILQFCTAAFALGTPGAEATFDKDATGKLQIQSHHEGDAIVGYQFRVYHIAHLAAPTELVLESKFDSFPLNPHDLLDASKYRGICGNLESYIDYQMLESDYYFETNERGEYHLSDLGLGLYYVDADIHYTTDHDGIRKEYLSQPFLIFVGVYDHEEGKWVYDFTAKPKLELQHAHPLTDVSVKKTWKNTEAALIAPQPVIVGLYASGRLFDMVVLNAENGWYHKWENLETRYTWAVREITELTDYKADYSHDGYDFYIKNTYIGEKPPPPSTPPPSGDLPQTGSTAPYIPRFASAGVLLILFGLLLKKAGARYAP